MHTPRALPETPLLSSQSLEFLEEILDFRGLFQEVFGGFRGSAEVREDPGKVRRGPGRPKKLWDSP